MTILDSGVPQAKVAKMMGHSGPEVLIDTYYYPEASQMASDVDAKSNTETERLKSIAEKVAAARAETKEKRRQANIASARRSRERAKLKAEPSDT
jgi:hypothetical protein